MCIAASRYIKRNRQRISRARRQYQQHIDELVSVLFPTHNNQLSSIHAVLCTQTSDTQYTEAEKRKMVADIRTYFNQRKINSAIAKTQASDDFVPISPYAGSHEELTFPTPPSIERLME
jgi:hypothetical protein